MKSKFKKATFLIILLLITPLTIFGVFNGGSAGSGGVGGGPNDLVEPATQNRPDISPDKELHQIEAAEAFDIPEAHYIFTITKSGTTYTATYTGGLVGIVIEPITNSSVNNLVAQAVANSKEITPNAVIGFIFGTGTAINIVAESIAFPEGIYIVEGSVYSTSTDGTLRLSNNIQLYITGGTIQATGDIGKAVTITGVNSRVYVSEENPEKPTLITSANITAGQGTLFIDSTAGTGTLLSMSGGKITNTAGSGTNIAIYNNSAGKLEIAGGTVQGIRTYGIYNNGIGQISISDATVIGGSYGIYLGTASASNYILTVSGSSINSINNGGSGSVRILDSTITGTINNAATGALEITGSTTAGIFNSSTGAITISNSTVNGGAATAIYCSGAAPVNISGNSLITSSNPNNTEGNATIYFAGGSEAAVLTINDSIVENTCAVADSNNKSRVIYNGAGTVRILSGTVRHAGAASSSAYAIYSLGNLDISGGTVNGGNNYAIYTTNATTLLLISEVNKDIPTLITSANTSGYGTLYSSGILNMSGGTVRSTNQSTSIFVGSNNSANIISGGTVEGLPAISLSSSRLTVSEADSGNPTLITSTNTAIGISSGTLTITGGTIQSTGNGNVIYNSYGTVTMSGGTVKSLNGAAIYLVATNNYNVSFTVTGGRIESAGGYAIFCGSNYTTSINISEADIGNPTVITSAYNNETIHFRSGDYGGLTISGGTVQNTGTGCAIQNSGARTVNISGGTVTSSNTQYGTIYNSNYGAIQISGGVVKNISTGNVIYNYSYGAIQISGGVVKNMSDGNAIYNNNYGSSSTVQISGGTVESITGAAVYNAANDYYSVTVTISEANSAVPTLVTSAKPNGGTIHMLNSIKDTMVTISGGTVKNTSPTGNAVYINSCNVSITGGIIQSVNTNVFSGTVHLNAGAITMSGGTVLNAAASGNAIISYSTVETTITGGTVQANNGAAIYNHNTGAITISQANVNVPTLITSANMSTLGTIYPGTIYLRIASTSTQLLTVNSGTIQNTSATGSAVYNNNLGRITVNGGRIEAKGGPAIFNAGAGLITVDQTVAQNPTVITSQVTNPNLGTIYLRDGSDEETVLTVKNGRIENTNTAGKAIYNYSLGNITLTNSPVINGIIYITAGRLEILTGFIPVQSGYVVHTINGNEWDVAIVNGANHIGYLLPDQNMEFSFGARGVDLVLVREQFTDGPYAVLFDWTYGTPNEPEIFQADYESYESYYKGRNGTIYASDVRPQDAGYYILMVTFTAAGGKTTEVQTFFTITARQIQITINDAEKIYKNDDPGFTHTITGGSLVGGDTLNVLSYIRQAGDNAGTYSIYSVTWDNTNYSITVVPGVLTINKANQADLVITSPAFYPYDETDYQITAEGGTLSNIVFELAAGGTGSGTINGNILMIYSPGTFIIRAFIAGNNNYEPVYSDYFTLTVSLEIFTIEFLDYDLSLIKRAQAEYGTLISSLMPENPVRDGFEFTGWQGYTEGMTVTCNAEFTALYTPVQITKYTVTFYDDDGSIIKSTMEEEGTLVLSLLPEPPVKAGFIFVRWDGYNDGMTVTDDLEFTAVYVPEEAPKYTITFYDDGGNIIKIITVIEGTLVSTILPINPYKAATAEFTYAFDGWEGYNHDDVVESDLSYTAIFTATLNSYKITFKDWNGSLLNIYTLYYGESILPPIAPLRAGYNFARWEGFVAGMTVTGNAVFTAAYTLAPVQNYTVTFLDEDDSVIESVQAIYGASVSMLLPPNPVKDGFEFARWEGYLSGMTVTGNLSFKAVYSAVNEEKFVVVFLDSDGKLIKEVKDVVKGTDISALFPSAPVKQSTAQYDYAFNGWCVYYDYDTVESDMTLKAEFTEILNEYVITFTDYDGRVLQSQMLDFGMSITPPEAPSRYGFKFIRWEGYIAGMTVSGNAEFFAVYSAAPGQKYTVTFYDENGTTVILKTDALLGADISTLFPEPPDKTGFAFARWDGYTAGMIVTGNISFKAVYTPVSEETFTVTFVDDNGTILKIIENAVKGTDISLLMPVNPVKGPTAELTYAFTGWQGYTLGDTVNGNLTFTAMFTATLNTYTILFKDYNGNLIANYQLDYGETIIPPNNPVREGYEFIRWEGFIAGITVTGSATFTAVYAATVVQKYTVTFLDEDNSIISEIEALEGSNVSILLPDAPEKEGFTFVRWEGYTAGMTVTSNISFKAVYANDTEETFTITFLDDDGTVIKIVYDVVKGTDISTLLPVNPSKDSNSKYTYVFAGWFGYNAGDTIQNNSTFTAVYTETLITYLIVFKDYDTSITAFYILTYGETIIPPANPERESFEFIRWEGFTEGLTVTGNAVFTAVYAPESSEKFTVTFYDEDGITIISETEEYAGTSVAMLLPAPPEKEGFLFVRWEGYTAGMTVTSNLSFKAVYAEDTEETFTVIFLDDDGTLIKIVYDVIKGADISTLLPADPFKAATAEFTYYFRGWYGFTIGSIIEGNLTLTASYTKVLNTYTISFYDENNNLLALFGAEYGTSIFELLIEPPYKEGFIFARWQGYTAGMVLTSNVEFTAVYVEEGSELYIITFYDEDGETIISQVQALKYTDISALLPEPPEKDGYLFARWEGYLAGMTAISDMTFTAVYTLDSEPRYTVIFLDDNETLIKILFDVVKGTDISTLFPSPPNKPATAEFTYIFTGWFDYNSCDIVEGHLVFIATYAETVNEYTVTFTDWDGAIISTYKLNYGDSITLPVEPPYREGYEFIRWENFIDGMKVTQDISFTAVYAFEPKTFTVTFYDNEGMLSQVTVPEGANVDLLLPVPREKDGFEFARWEGYFAGMTVMDDLNFYAVYTEINEEKFTVTFIDDEGNIILILTNVVKGSDISALLPADNPVKASTPKYTYVFKGWYGFNHGDTVQYDITLIASYTEVLKTYTVTFLDFDGSEIKTIIAAYGVHISELLPDNPERPYTEKYNYTFSGWKGYFVGMTVAGNISFTAEYKEELNKYMVTFLNWDGSTLYQITVFYGESVVYETIPFRTGYTFSGWDELLEFITENLTVTAIYTANEYIVIINDGENETEIIFEYGTELEPPKAPVKEGYIFEGWYLDKDCTILCDFKALPAENITLYAKWSKEPGIPIYLIVILALIFIIIVLSVTLHVKKSKTRKLKRLVK